MRTSIRTKFAAIGIVAVSMHVTVSCGPIGPQDALISLKPDQKFQMITGWEAVAQACQDYSKAYPKYRDSLFDIAVNELGVNRLRLELRSGLENPTDHYSRWRAGLITEKEFSEKRYEVINDNGDPNVSDPKGFQFSELDSSIENVVLPIRNLMANRGEKLFVNLNFVDFGSGRGTSNIRHNDDPNEYAEFVHAAFEHMNAKYGFVPDAVEVILEPDNHTGWSGQQIGKAIVSTSKRLSASGFRPGFIAPSTTNASNAPEHIDQIATVAGAMEPITEFSYHRYCCASEPVLKRITERAEKYGKQTAMLEWVGADYETLHEDLKQANNSAWEQYSLAGLTSWGPDKGESLILIDDKNSEQPKLSVSRRAIYLRQYFRYIRSGARRIGAETSNPHMDPVAFVNDDGSYAVVVKAGARGRIQVRGLPAGTYAISLTTGGKTSSDIPDQKIADNGVLAADMPGSGVITVVGRLGGAKAH